MYVNQRVVNLHTANISIIKHITPTGILIQDIETGKLNVYSLKDTKAIFMLVPDELSDNVAKLQVEEQPIGLRCRSKFLDIIKNLDVDDDIEIVYKPNKREDWVKCNGYNVFMCKQTKSYYKVYAHPRSISPHNRKYCWKLKPKNQVKTLRAVFVFDELRTDIMRSIIVDGLYYRSRSRKENDPWG